MVEAPSPQVGLLNRPTGILELIQKHRRGTLITPELDDSLSAYEAQLRSFNINYQAGREVYRRSCLPKNELVRNTGFEIADGVMTVWIIDPKFPSVQIRSENLQKNTYYQYIKDRTREIDIGLAITSQENQRCHNPELDRLYSEMRRVRRLAQAQLLGYADCAFEQGDWQSAILAFAAITITTDQGIASLLDSQVISRRIMDNPISSEPDSNLRSR